VRKIQRSCGFDLRFRISALRAREALFEEDACGRRPWALRQGCKAHEGCAGEAIRRVPGTDLMSGGSFAGLCWTELRLMRAHVPMAKRVRVSQDGVNTGLRRSHDGKVGGPRGLMTASSFIRAPQCGQQREVHLPGLRLLLGEKPAQSEILAG
jgi:hypothetical protein